MSNFESDDKTSRPEGEQLASEQSAFSALELLSDGRNVGDSTSPEMTISTRSFATADASVHADAAQVAHLFTPANREAILKNMPT